MVTSRPAAGSASSRRAGREKASLELTFKIWSGYCLCAFFWKGMKHLNLSAMDSYSLVLYVVEKCY